MPGDLMHNDTLKYLSSNPLFTCLSKKELKKAADSSHFKRLEKGSVIAVKGKTKIQGIYVVKKGRISLFDEKSGRKETIGFLDKGDVFGGISILLNAGLSLRTATVEEDTDVLSISERILTDLCMGNKNFFEHFLENFSNNIFDESLDAFIETGQARIFLSGVDPFTFLSDEEIEHTAQKLSIVHYPKDTVLFTQGRSRVGYLYILQKGSAERYYNEKSEKRMREILSEGDIYGGITMLLNDGVSVRTMQVMEDSYFYVLPKQAFLDICNSNKAFTEFFSDTFGKRMLNRSYASIIAKALHPSEDELHFFNQTIKTIYTGKAIFADADVTIRDSALKMVKEKASYVFINEKKDHTVGIVTEKDLSRKVVAKGFGIEQPVNSIMSFPLHTISEKALVFEALIQMMQQDIQHLAVTDANDRIVGMLSNRDILSSQGHSPIFLISEISSAVTVNQLIDEHKKLPGIVRNLITNGANAENVTRFITTVSDAILKKIMKIVLDDLGPPPVPYVFMILGSEGRREQTLKTDQDNAIIYQDPPESDKIGVKRYFKQMGEKVCNLLDQVGYDFCVGNVMAKNPKWNQPLSQWKKYFTSWIHAGEPQDLLQASIFFDFRGGYGDFSLINRLRNHLFTSLEGWSGFFRNLTENALHFKPPIGFFRNFVVESKGRHRNAFNIKSAMLPIVDFARVFSLEAKIEETNTLERLNQLYMRKVLNRQEFEEIEKAYSFLMQLRFIRQVAAVIEDNTKPDNYINPKKLTTIEQTMLKEIFKRIERFQAKLNFEFIGIA